jgi:hypothetical protein
MGGAKLAKLPQGARTDLEPRANLHEVSAAQAAQMLSVSERTVKAAKAVQRTAVPEIVAAVEAGQLAVSTAAEIVRPLPQGDRAAEGMVRRRVPVQRTTAQKARAGALGLSYWLTTKPGGGGGIFSFAAEPDKSG